MKPNRKVTVTAFAVLVPTLLFGQSRPEFEVASIRPTPPATTQVAAGLKIDGAQIRVTYLSLKDYIGLAYRVRIDQILGPDFLGTERFDVAAKLPDGGKPDQVPEMLQSLLADRFQMEMHREKKEFPVYALVVDKGGLKIKELPPDPDSAGDNGFVNVAAGGNSTGVAVDFGKGASFTLGTTRLEVKKLAMPAFADMLTRFLDRPVLDMTELKGNYDLTLDLSPEDRQAMLIRSAVAAGVVLPPQALRLMDLASGDSVANALQRIGLRLEPRKAPLDVVVIDRILKVPTEN